MKRYLSAIDLSAIVKHCCCLNLARGEGNEGYYGYRMQGRKII